MPVPRRLRTQWDWVAGYSLIGIAAVMVVVTWVEVSGSRFVSDELASIASGGLGALVLLGLGSVLIVTAGLADEWRKLNRLEELFDCGVRLLVPVHLRDNNIGTTRLPWQRYIGLPGIRRRGCR